MFNTIIIGGDSSIHLGRTSEDECTGVDLVCESCAPFENENFTVTDSATFIVTIGPSGNQRGYLGITGIHGCTCTVTCTLYGTVLIIPKDLISQ